MAGRKTDNLTPEMIASLMRETGDPEVALEIASTWDRKEMRTGLQEYKTLLEDEECEEEHEAAQQRIAAIEIARRSDIQKFFASEGNWELVDRLLAEEPDEVSADEINEENCD